ncbi:MAG: histidine phosphatase family protein [Cyanobacteria bacterium P01_H01_bin.58]
MTLKLLFIRHGESTGNQNKRMVGHLEDNLTAIGHRQCQQLAQYLCEQRWLPSHIYTSPLRRAVESLTCLLEPWAWTLPDRFNSEEQSLNLWQPMGAAEGTLSHITTMRPPQVKVSDALMEFQTGILTGLTWAEAQHRYPDLCNALETSVDWVPIPQAETPQAGRDRAQQFLQHLLQTQGSDDAIWLISHHWIMEHLIAVLLGCDRTWQLTIPNTALFEFWIDRDRWFEAGTAPNISSFWQIKRFGERPHLS